MSRDIILLLAAIVIVGGFLSWKLPNARGMILVCTILIAGGIGVLKAVQYGPALLLKPPSQPRIAFICDEAGVSNLWTMKMDGTDRKAVTKDKSNTRLAAWSPSGTEIASISDRDGGVFQLIISGWDGSYSHRVTTSAGTKDSPNWSPDGSNIVFICSGSIFDYDYRGGDEEQVLPTLTGRVENPNSWTSAPFSFSSFSPDRKYISCVQETDDGRVSGILETLAGDLDSQSLGSSDPIFPITARSLDLAWSPKTNKCAVAFVNRKSQNGMALLDMDLTNNSDLFVTKGDTTGALKPCWSPDEQKIAFEMWRVKDGSPDRSIGIYTVDSSGGKPEKLVSGDAKEPSWSADGRYVVYTLPRKDGMRDVWRVNADGTGAVNLTKGKGDCSSPACSPAGKKRAS